MKKILLGAWVIAGAWNVSAQCDHYLSATDTLICQGDTVTMQASGPITQLQTTLAAGNNHRGNMFKITALNDIIINGFSAHPLGNTTIEIYYKSGDFVGFENNAAAWTLAGSAAVVAQPTGTPTPVPVTVGLTVPAGQTYSFYVTSNNTGISLNYSNGSSFGSLYASDANLEFFEGYGIEYPFSGSPFSPRIWNGIIHYSLVNGTTYSWSTGGTTNTMDVMPTVTTTYYVDMNTPGCATYTDSVTVTVSELNINLGSNQDLCAGGTEVLNAGSAVATYMWNSDPMLNQAVLTVTSGGTYYVEASDSIGCSSADTIVITEHALPVIDLGPDTVFCVEQSLVLDAGSGYSAYLWSTGATTSTITVDGTQLTAGTYDYMVDVSDLYGCIGSDTVQVVIDPCLGLEEGSMQVAMVYPNPTSGQITVEWAVHGETVRVYGHDGKLVLEQAANGMSQTIDLSGFADGTYLMELNTADSREMVQIIKR